MAERQARVLSPRARVIIPFVVILLVTTISLEYSAVLMMDKALSRTLEQQSKSLTRNLADVLAEPLSLGEVDHMVLILSSAQRADCDLLYAYVLSPDGTVVVATDAAVKNMRLDRDDFERAALTATEASYHEKSGSGSFEWVMPIKAAGTQAGTVRVGFSRRRVEDDVFRAAIPVVMIGLVSLVVGTCIFLAVIRHAGIGTTALGAQVEDQR